ncbi:Hypothetical protein PHPALM_6271 [Phytophthora palmivora]|uniref:Uncharacterized protein n=1 Tax=Phytophthora palmivora TaxID=4796 RepID=A0A2P4YFA7_9STRA|nr:Hypothetical protein PHPALM_6271 [Phytophthora palmivora]
MLYSLDTAADQSGVPQDTLNSLRVMQPTLEVLKLSVALEAVMANGQTQMCAKEVLLDLELATVAGSVPCLVLAGDGGEFLLGRELLKRLGIDVELQLSQLAGSSLLEDEVDEFPVGDEIPLATGATETENSLGQLIKRAAINGLPVDHVGALRELVAAFPYICRDRVGPDPPADAEPLRVTVQPDAPNNESRWAWAVVPARKPGTQDKFRLTIDYRPVNNVTIPIAGGILSAASLLDAFENFKDKKVFGRADFAQGF